MYTNIIHNDDICNYFLKNQQFIFNSLGNCRECRMIMEILSSSIQAGLRDLNLSAAISAPVLIGEDRVGLIIYQEGRIPLFWDSPIAEMYERMAIIPSLLEMQPEIVGSNGVHDDASCDENEADDSIKNIRILAETLVDVQNR